MSATVHRLLAVGAIILLIIGAGARFLMNETWQRQQRNIFFLMNIDLPATEAAAADWLVVGREQLSSDELNASADSCWQLWLSRLSAGLGLADAPAALEAAATCERREGYYGWVGNLAWMQGEHEEALALWRQILLNRRLTWGINLLRSDQDKKGRALLDDLVRSDQLGDAGTAQLSYELGNSFNEAGELEQAAQYYLQAWELGDRTYRLAYNLGSVMRRLDRCEEAVVYFDQGQAYRSPSTPPMLLGEYALEQARCYDRLGVAGQADLALQQLAALLEDPQLSAQERDTLRERLEQVRGSQ